MFLNLMQVGSGVNLDPNQMQQLQDQFNNLNNLAASPAAQQALKTGGWLVGWILGVVIVLGLIALVLTIINLINIYHWGMTDKAVFEKANETKKKWFVNLVLVPVIASAVAIIPLVGWVAGAIIYIYWLVMTLIYFFGMRKKLV